MIGPRPVNFDVDERFGQIPSAQLASPARVATAATFCMNGFVLHTFQCLHVLQACCAGMYKYANFLKIPLFTRNKWGLIHESRRAFLSIGGGLSLSPR
jgi:hypothetical protein